MLQAKCIRSAREAGDGLRISVMSRHTLNDGETPDPTIQPEMYDDWQPLLAPPARLLGDYYKRGLSWNEFVKRYNMHLEEEEPYAALHGLATTALSQNVTVVCTEISPDHCHRRLIAEKAQLIVPELIIAVA